MPGARLWHAWHVKPLSETASRAGRNPLWKVSWQQLGKGAFVVLIKVNSVSTWVAKEWAGNLVEMMHNTTVL